MMWSDTEEKKRRDAYKTDEHKEKTYKTIGKKEYIVQVRVLGY